jgi:choline kinase
MSAPRTFAGVLAAGHGTRFQAAGVRTPKALVPVSGRSLLLRTLDAFEAAGFESVTIVVNDAVAPLVREHLASNDAPLEAALHVKTTASTLETFTTLLELAAAAAAPRFVFTTVDAVSAAGELARFARAAGRASEPLALGVSDIEEGDESPLRVLLEPSGLARLGEGSLATMGFYAGATEPVLRAARAALAQGLPSLRAFLTLRASLSEARGILLGKTVDVDTPRDVAMAERALQGWGRPPSGEDA